MSVRMLLWAFLLAEGCAMDPVALDGKACPCAPGWICDRATITCFRELDAGRASDAGTLDAGAARDAAVEEDAGAADAALADATVDDGGAPDAPTDAGPDETACDDLLAGAFFCDGYEDPSFAAWVAGDESNGTVTRVTSPVHRGSGALRAETTAPRGRAATVAVLPTVGSGDLYMRGYFLVPEDVTVSSLSFLYATEWASPYDGVAAGIETDGRAWAWIGPTTTTHGTGMAPQGRWFCMQVHVVVADSGGSVEVTIDGESVLRADGLDTLPDGRYVRLFAGLERAGGDQEAAVVYADEIAAGTSPLPCD